MSQFKKWRCPFCGYIYDEAIGDAEHGIDPGTHLEDFPADWVCPDCGAYASDFVEDH